MRTSGDFSRTVRQGARAGRPSLVLHLLGPDPSDAEGAARVGVVVSRAVGGSVVRTGVKRRLRHLLAARLERLGPGSRLVVRALPTSAAATSAQLGADLDQALGRALERAARVSA